MKDFATQGLHLLPKRRPNRCRNGCRNGCPSNDLLLFEVVPEVRELKGRHANQHSLSKNSILHISSFGWTAPPKKKEGQEGTDMIWAHRPPRAPYHLSKGPPHHPRVGGLRRLSVDRLAEFFRPTQNASGSPKKNRLRKMSNNEEKPVVPSCWETISVQTPN